MNTDDDLVMISALQHFLFCPRQCALIHIEKVWEENYLTAAGRTLHERVDRTGTETRKDIHLATALNLVSKRLGVTGIADMVEFRKTDSAVNGEGVTVAIKLPKKSGWWIPFPVEYKRGAPKLHRADEVQLCAQALCLEEMLGVTISAGALFYGETRRRTDVVFDGELRALTEKTIEGARNLLRSGTTPPPVLTKGCKACSLVDLCRPEELGTNMSAKRWIRLRIDEASR